METEFPERFMYTVSNTLLECLLGHFAQNEQFAFFDTSRPTEDNVTSHLFVAPVSRLQCGINDSAEDFLAQVQGWLDQGYYLAGWFGYEFGSLLDRHVAGLTSRPGKNTDLVADLGVFREHYRFDHRTGECDFPLRSGKNLNLPSYQVTDIRPNLTKDEYLEALKTILEYIRAGDTYQVNYTLKLLFELTGSVESFYRALRRNQSVSYGAYIRWGEERILSFSPELFFRKSGDTITVRPMKGTLRRGRDMGEDSKARAFLHQDEKNRSENVMIVDLLRNDLARVLHESGGGDVRVESLFDVEPYESLLQMTSTIHARAAQEQLAKIPLANLFRALFPCGSVTGAPKIRTMEIIAEQEKERRGVYTGAIGFLAPDGSAVFNVPIRTLVLKGSQGEMGIGSGVIHDSDPHGEWHECLLKGRFLTNPVPDFELIETLLWKTGSGYWLLEDHLQRLRESAEYFYFFCDLKEVRRKLEVHVREATGKSRRVRLTLAKDGAVTISSEPFGLPLDVRLPQRPQTVPGDLPLVRFSATIVNSGQPWVMHKTTNREVYNREFKQALATGLYDNLYLNERGEVTESSIANVVIYKDGRYRTPPLSCGLLRGVMRMNLLREADPPVSEEVLTSADIRAAEAIFLCNSVRGVVQVRLAAD